MTTDLATKRPSSPSRTHRHNDTTVLSEGISRKREARSEGSKKNVVASVDASKPTFEDEEIEISGPFPLSHIPVSTKNVPRTDLKDAVVQQAVTTSLNGSTTFEDDFIPFDSISPDPSDDNQPGRSRRKRRRMDRINEREREERETEKHSDRDDTTGRQQLSERRQTITTNNDLGKVPTTSDRDRVKKGKSKMLPEREWDRGKEAVVVADDDKYDRRNGGNGKNRKRKHDDDDGYSGSKQKQRVEVVGSRKCPWVANLDLNRCSNVAEM